MPVLDLGPEKPQPGTLADANAISNAFTKIESVVNDLDDTNFASGTPIEPSSIASGGAQPGDVLSWNGSAWVPGGGVPTGSVFPYAGLTAPGGYFLCDGSSKPKNTYGALWNALGGLNSPHGQDANNFNLPDLKGRIPVAPDASAEFPTPAPAVPAKKAGHKLLQSHGHTVNAHSHPMSHDHPLQMSNMAISGTFGDGPPTGSAGGNIFDSGGSGVGAPVKMFNGNTSDASPGTSPSGGGDAQNLQPYLVLNYIIKY